MSRQRYVLRDTRGLMVATVLTQENEDPELEPWMAENLRSRGWTIEKYEDPIVNAIDVHGYADWKSVSEVLAEALRPLLDDEHSVNTEGEAEDFLDKAQKALDAFEVAQMEAAMASIAVVAEQQPEPPEQEDDDSDDS